MPDETFQLTASTIPNALPGGVVIVASGLVGLGSYSGRRSRGEVRTATAERNDFDIALDEAGLEDRHTITLEAATPVVPEQPQTRRGEAEIQDNEVILEVPSSPDEFQYALYQDEDGVVTFHFPDEIRPGQSLTVRSATREKIFRYRVELRPIVVARPQKEATTRGVMGKLAHKLIKVVVGKIVDYGAQNAAYGLVWHGRKIGDHLRDSMRAKRQT